MGREGLPVDCGCASMLRESRGVGGMIFQLRIKLVATFEGVKGVRARKKIWNATMKRITCPSAPAFISDSEKRQTDFEHHSRSNRCGRSWSHFVRRIWS